MTEIPDSVVEVSDPAEFLRDKQGIFAVISAAWRVEKLNSAVA
jgi:hypothetical protein